MTLTGASDGGVEGSGVHTPGSSGQEESEENKRRDRDSSVNNGNAGPIVERPKTGEEVAAAKQPSFDGGRSKCYLFQGEAEETMTPKHHGVIARMAAAGDGGSEAAGAFSVAFGSTEYNARRKKRTATGYATLRQLGRELCKADAM